jgi:flagellar biosynthesis GTPase FlhF
MEKLLVLLVVPLAALAAPQVGFGDASDQEIAEIRAGSYLETVDDNPQYNFQYKVADDKEQTYIAMDEERAGDTVSGTYSYVDPLGSLIVVTYTAGPMGYQETREVKENFVTIRARPARTQSVNRVAEAEAQRLEAQRLQAQRLEAQRAEAQRLEAQRLEAQRLEAQRLEAQRAEAQRLEAQRLEAQRLETQRLEAQRLEAQRIAEAEAAAEAQRLKTRETHCLRLKGSRLLDSRLKQQQLQRTRRSTLSLRLSPRFNRSSHRPSALPSPAQGSPVEGDR